MKKIKEFFQKLNHRHYIAWGITLLFVLLGAFVYRASYIRFGETVRDLALSVVYYYKTIFEIPGDLAPTVVGESVATYPIKDDYPVFVTKFLAYWSSFADKSNFMAYLEKVFDVFFVGSAFGGIIVALVIAMYQLFKTLFYRENNDHGEESKPLKAYKGALDKTYYPVKEYIRTYIDFLSTNKAYPYIWLCIWLLNLNVVSILCAVLAYFFHFSCTFDVTTIYKQLYKLVLDLSLMFSGLPVPIWIVIGLVLFDVWRHRRADKVLHRLDGANRAFVEELPTCTFIAGNMGKGKTLLATSLALNCRANFRDKAYEILYKCDMKFPDFPWGVLEQVFINSLERGDIYNLATANNFANMFIYMLTPGLVKRCVERHNRRHPDRAVEDVICVDYSLDLPHTYNSGNKIEYLEDVIRTYCAAFFIYTCDNFNISNYAIRVDDELDTQGNFPLWNNDSICRESFNATLCGHYSKILDFDVTRPTKQVVVENPLSGSLEFGVLNISEIGKERLNQVESQGLRKDDDFANQKNDGFNTFLKLCRHPSTVDYYPFFKLFCDDQRPESLNADNRELTTITYIDDKLPERYALPLGLLEYDACTWLCDKFSDVYYKFRYYRGDNTLIMYLLKHTVKLFFDRKERIKSKYGICELALSLEAGTMDGSITSERYYLLNKVVYADRYATDCFADYFQKKAIKSGKGLRDYKEYAGVRATLGEMKLQNSYLMSSLFGTKKKETPAPTEEKGFEKYLKGLYKADVKRKEKISEQEEASFEAWQKGYERGYEEQRRRQLK